MPRQPAAYPQCRLAADELAVMVIDDRRQEGLAVLAAVDAGHIRRPALVAVRRLADPSLGARPRVVDR